MVQPKQVRIQDKGQVTLPAEIRRRLGLKRGDVVTVFATDDGVVIAPQDVVAARALDGIGEALREQGLALDDLIESGRLERDDLLREQYGIDPAG